MYQVICSTLFLLSREISNSISNVTRFFSLSRSYIFYYWERNDERHAEANSKLKAKINFFFLYAKLNCRITDDVSAFCNFFLLLAAQVHSPTLRGAFKIISIFLQFVRLLVFCFSWRIKFALNWIQISKSLSVHTPKTTQFWRPKKKSYSESATARIENDKMKMKKQKKKLSAQRLEVAQKSLRDVSVTIKTSSRWFVRWIHNACAAPKSEPEL